ncbi:NAD(P)H-hydrate epimerase [Corynebacterium sp.]|uniref:NAD(P)H-hydrate epimerase n=1 Tax=Corynebacterium sp. TaxID=1720 RepID=UPI0028A6F238|nr:NAD(P)H-hydrate epimerase [Corynebacterium sp.]
MWTVYTGEQYRAALEEWADGEPEPEDWRTRRDREERYDQEAQAVAACVEVEQQRRDHPVLVFILVGAGGNGRVGLRAASLLVNRGYRVEVELLPVPREGDNPDLYPGFYDDQRVLWRDDATPEAHELLERFLAYGGQITSRRFNDEGGELCITVDAICGRGIDGRLCGPAIAWACHVDVAIDSPTGMLPDSGRTVPASERAQPAQGGFTAATTVVLGGLRAVHLLREDCGRLVYVPGGLGRLLRRAEDERLRAADAADMDVFDTHKYFSVRTRSGVIVRDPSPEKAVPAYPDSDGHGAVYHPEVMGNLDLLFDVRRRLRPAPHVCIVGVPQRRPGVPVLVAAGATGVRPVDLLADEDAVRQLGSTYPETEVSDGDIRETALPHVLCSGLLTARVETADKLVVTRDAVRDWLDGGDRPPERSVHQRSVLVVDRPTANTALNAWCGECDEEMRPNRWDPVTAAEELAACTGYGVVLTGPTVVYCRGNKTFLVRTTTEASRVQGMPEVIAGAVAATGLQDDLPIEAALTLLACTAVVVGQDPVNVPTARRIAQGQRRTLRGLQAPSREAANALP